MPTTTLEQVYDHLSTSSKSKIIEVYCQVGSTLRKLNLALNYFNELGSTGSNQVNIHHLGPKQSSMKSIITIIHQGCVHLPAHEVHHHNHLHQGSIYLLAHEVYHHNHHHDHDHDHDHALHQGRVHLPTHGET